MLKRIVITGMAAICAIGDSIQQINSSLKEERSGITKQYIEGIGERYLGKVDIPFENGDGKICDKSTLFALHCTPMAIANASIKLKDYSPSSVSVVISSSKSGILSIINAHNEFLKNKKSKLIAEYFNSYIGIDLSQRVANKLGVTGAKLNYPSACATGSISIVAGMNLIREGYAEVVIAGSSETSIHPLIFSGFEQTGVISKGICKPFNKTRDGFNMGEGCGLFVLEDFEMAKNRGADIIAEVLGYSFGGDAYHITSFETSGETIAHNIRKAIEKSGIKINEIDYINAHGTGTIQNDAVETRAIKKAFGNYAYKIPISSLKPYFGHLLGASSSVEIVASLIAMRNNYIPPTLFLDEQDEECDLNYVPMNIIEKEFSTMLKLSYGFGGNIVVLVLRKVVN